MSKKERIKQHLDTFIELNILLTLFTLPFSKSLVEICVTLAILAFFVKKVFIEKKIRLKINRKILISLLLFLGFNLISIVNSQYLYLSIPAFFSKVLKWVILFIIVADTIRTSAQLKRVFITMLFSAVLILADAVYQQYITGVDFLHYPERYRVFKWHARLQGHTSYPTASFPFPNDFAAWLIIFLFTFLVMAIFDLQEKKRYRILLTALSGFLGFFLFLTTVRGALLGAFFSSLLLLGVNVKKFVIPVVIFFIILLLAVSLIPYLNTYLKEGILNISLSFNDRISMWRTGWQIFKEHPFVGNGVNTFFDHFRNLRQDEDRYKLGSYAHNCFLQMAADIGIFGLVSFLSFVFFVIFPNIKRRKEELSTFRNSFVFGLSLGVIAFLVHSFFDTNLYSLNLAALFWISLGFIEGMGSYKE